MCYNINKLTSTYLLTVVLFTHRHWHQRNGIKAATFLPSEICWWMKKGFHFACAAVAVDSRHMTASSSTSWSRFSPPSNFVNWHMLTMWFMVWCWPQSQEGDWARRHLCKFPRRGPWRKDEARPLIKVRALCSLQCFDTDGWVEGRIPGPWNPVLLMPRRSLPEHVEKEDARANWLTQVRYKKRPLIVVIVLLFTHVLIKGNTTAWMKWTSFFTNITHIQKYQFNSNFPGGFIFISFYERFHRCLFQPVDCIFIGEVLVDHHQDTQC